MDAGIGFLEIYAEICLGTVAFMAIVATLRQTLGESLTAYQYLITRFFIDVGLVQVLVAISGLATFAISQHANLTWQVMSWMLIANFVFYLPYYLYKRSKIAVERSVPAVVIIISIGASSVNLILVAFDISQMPLSSAVLVNLVVILAALVLTFFIFVGSFMSVKD
jgi:hypothetical protein